MVKSQYYFNTAKSQYKAITYCEKMILFNTTKCQYNGNTYGQKLIRRKYLRLS